MLKLSPQQKRLLVEALLECPILQTSQGRDQLVKDLPAYIQHSIKRRDDGRSDVVNILDRALNYVDGLPNLLQAMAFYEGDSLPYREVLRLAGLAESTMQPDLIQPEPHNIAQMPDISTAVVAILSPAGHPKGAGFLAAKRLILTCAHVVAQAGAAPGEVVQVRFHGQEASRIVIVSAESWRSPNEEDIAVLRLVEGSPAGIKPLTLGEFRDPGEHPFGTFGFPSQGALSGGGQIVGWAKIGGQRLLQLRSTEVTQGFSGSPVWANDQGHVVGMITSITTSDVNERLKETAFATPTSVLQQCLKDTIIE